MLLDQVLVFLYLFLSRTRKCVAYLKESDAPVNIFHLSLILHNTAHVNCRSRPTQCRGCPDTWCALPTTHGDDRSYSGWIHHPATVTTGESRSRVKSLHGDGTEISPREGLPDYAIR